MKKLALLLMMLLAMVAIGACNDEPTDDMDVVIEEPIEADDTMATDTMMSDTAMSDTTMTDTTMTDTSMTDTTMTDTTMTDNDGM